MAERGLSPRACLLAQSRGGLQHYNWAVKHLGVVSCIAGIYALVNVQGLRLSDVRLHAAYGLDGEAHGRQAAAHNPVERLAPLAEHRVPVFSIHGDNDSVVPLEENAGELTRRYRALGREAELVLLPGLGRAEVPPFFTSQALLDFILARGRRASVTVLPGRLHLDRWGQRPRPLPPHPPRSRQDSGSRWGESAPPHRDTPAKGQNMAHYGGRDRGSRGGKVQCVGVTPVPATILAGTG